MSDLSDLGKLSSVDTAVRKVTRKIPRKQQAAMICYQLPEVAHQLRIIAAEQSKTQQALLAEGLNAVFIKYGKPPIAS
jgi:tRNA G26 N,N-dimethylase Trm1